MLTSAGCGHTTDEGGASGGSGGGGELGRGGASGGGPGGVAAPGGAPSMALEPAQSGERLVALGYSSNETQVFKTFHDQDLGVDCDFVPDAARKLHRCAPSPRVALRFTDAACTEPAAEVWRYDPTPELGTGSLVSAEPNDPWSGCPGDAPPHRDTFVIGEKLTEEVVGGPPIPLFALRDGRCETAPLWGKVTPPIYALEPLPESELVAAERVSLAVSRELRVTRLVAEDGAALTVGVTLTDGTPCEFQPNGECVPEPIARSSVFQAGRFPDALNADCSVPAFLSPYPLSCGTPSYGVEGTLTAPGRVFAVEAATAAFHFGPVLPIADPPAYACSRVSAPDGVSHALAPSRDMTGTFPQARRVSRGSGPLHVDWFATGDHLLLPVRIDLGRASPGVVPSGELLTADGQLCTVWPADDGTLRCVVVSDYGAPIAAPTSFPELKIEPM